MSIESHMASSRSQPNTSATQPHTEKAEQNEFYGKVAVVTGAKQGIGAATRKALQRKGAVVVGIDMAFEKDGKNEYLLDITNAKQVNHLIHHIENQYGPIAFAVNAAGILTLGPLLETTDTQWQHTFAVNTTGAFNIFRAIGQAMTKRRSGALVAISSNAAHAPRCHMGAYSASKAATTQLIKCLGLELAVHNIRCNIVAPGSTDTPMQQQMNSGLDYAERAIQGDLATHRLGIPLRRIATPENVAEAALFLLSNAAAHITMETLVIDGGATLGNR